VYLLTHSITGNVIGLSSTFGQSFQFQIFIEKKKLLVV